jgi:hypothetical protein
MLQIDFTDRVCITYYVRPVVVSYVLSFVVRSQCVGFDIVSYCCGKSLDYYHLLVEQAVIVHKRSIERKKRCYSCIACMRRRHC